MNTQERQQHNAQIYQEWLDGADIADLGGSTTTRAVRSRKS